MASGRAYRAVMLRVAASGVLALFLVAVAAVTAGAAGPSPYRHSLTRVDAALRNAIEVAPVEMGEGMLSSEVVCELAQSNERRGDSESAGADWSTLSQLVDQVDAPAVEKVDRAFARADSLLRSLRRRFAAAWADQPQAVRRLNGGVASARAGIRRLRTAVERTADSLAAWKGRECAAAIAAIEAGVGGLPAGIEKVNAGMGRLWALAEVKGR
jgi:hypothetical protein